MNTGLWPSTDLIFFDCDSTLSRIEGIDELARLKGKEGRVGLLTNKAMDGELDLADVYGKRLKAIRPSRAQLKAIEERYWETTVEDTRLTIAALAFSGQACLHHQRWLDRCGQGFRSATWCRCGQDSSGPIGIQRALRRMVALP